MEIINAISVPFYKFKAPEGLNEIVLQDLETKTYRRSDPNQENGGIFDDYFHEELFQFFEDSVNQIKNLYFEDNIEFPIVDCWANKYTTMQKLLRHNHSNAFICGCYYVTSHDKHGATVWDMVNPWTHNSQGDSILAIKKSEKFLSGEVYPEAGTLVLFPAVLPHFMKTISKMKTVRYTIAFNTFASGTISSHSTGKLTVATQSVRERVKLGLQK